MAKIHVPLLYTRIWQLVAVDLSPSLSIQNFPPFYGGGKFERLIVDGLSRHGALVGNLLPLAMAKTKGGR